MWDLSKAKQKKANKRRKKKLKFSKATVVN